jgi:hypothetical protein
MQRWKILAFLAIALILCGLVFPVAAYDSAKMYAAEKPDELTIQDAK